MTNLQNEERIIQLLEEQNENIKTIADSLTKKEKREKINQMIQISSQTIALIVLFVIFVYIYMIFRTYLKTLNENINILREQYLSLITITEKFIPDLNSAKEIIKGTWQEINKLL